MTAPAATLIQRPPQLREHVREAHPAAQGTRADSGFAAHLERRDPPPLADWPTSAPTPANETRTAGPAPVLATAPDAAPPGEPAIEPATGKSLPNKWQIPALAAALAVQTVLSARAAAKGETASAETAPAETAPAETAPAETGPPDAEPITAAIAGNASPMLPILLAAPAPATSPAPAPALRAAAPPAAATTPKASLLPRIGSAARSAQSVLPARTDAPAGVQTSGANSATPGPATTKPATTNPATTTLSTTSPATTSPAATAPAATAPAVSLLLERDIAAPGTPDPVAAVPAAAEPTAADARPSASQAEPRSEPYTLAALTGAQTPGRAALRKGRSETEAALPATKVSAPEVTPSSFALAQPAANILPGSGDPVAPAPIFASASASGQPAEGIGFDALVDSIARARDDAAVGAPVAVAMRHAEFGRISLRFHTDADGLSVAMTSPDPDFAPAVAAAHAAEAAASTEAASRTAPTGAPANTAATSAASDSSGSQMQGGTRSGAGQRQDGPPQHHRSAEPSRTTPRGAEATADDTRGGIFA